MVSPEQLKTFFASPGWHYVEERMKEWQESYLRDLLAETDLHEVLRIQARLQQLDAMLRIKSAFVEDLDSDLQQKLDRS